MKRHRFPTQPVTRLLGILALLSLGIPSIPSIGEADDTHPYHDLQGQGWTLDFLTAEGTDRPGVRHVSARARIQIPAELIWQVIATDRGQGQWPGIKESVLEWARGDTSIRRYTLSIPIFRDRRYKLLNVADEERMSLRFSMVPGYGNVHEIEGRWDVSALSDSLTRVEYHLDTDPGVHLVPTFIVEWVTKKAIPRTFAFLYEQGLLQMEAAPTPGREEDRLKLGERFH